MLRGVFIFLLALPLAVTARPHVSLPPAEFADTETTTNMPFFVGDSRCFRFALSFVGTPSNNVQVALGVDADANGVLSLSETRMVAGWDCGRWFVRDFVGGRTYDAAAREMSGRRSFEWHVTAPEEGGGPSLSITADGEGVFSAIAALMPSWIHDPNWNMLRLTGRGADELRDSFLLSPGGLVIRIR